MISTQVRVRIRVRARLGIFWVAALILLTAGCTGETASRIQPSGPTRSPSVTPGRVSTTTTTVPTPTARVRWAVEKTIPLPRQADVANIALFGHYLAWDSNRVEGVVPTTLYVEDLATDKIRMVAHTEWAQGDLSWQVGTGDYVVWLDDSAEPTDEEPNTLWRMWAENLVTGRRWLLAKNSGVPLGSGPLPEANDGRVLWLRPDQDGRTRDIVLYDLSTDTETVPVRHVLAFNAYVSAGRIIYDDDDPPHQAGANLKSPPKTREVYSIPLHGGAATDIGGNRNAHSPQVWGSYATWGEPKYGDQHSIWSAPVDGSAPARIAYRGTNVQQAPGADFIAFWTEGNGLYVTALNGTTRGTDVQARGEQEYVPAHFSPQGHRLAFATVRNFGQPDELITLHVDRIEIEPLH